jgi:hypothetical protein
VRLRRLYLMPDQSSLERFLRGLLGVERCASQDVFSTRKQEPCGSEIPFGLEQPLSDELSPHFFRRLHRGPGRTCGQDRRFRRSRPSFR